MAGGSKKKKTKAAVNPARGFATTSLASKKTSELETSSTEPSGVATPDIVALSTDLDPAIASEVPGKASKELHELSPEEFEAQLYESELQQFVEKNATKVRKDASRQVTRLHTDRRLLRSQAEFLSVKDWLPDELMQEIVDLVLEEVQSDASKPNLPLGDDLLSKVWALRLCLSDIDVPPARIDEAIGYVLTNIAVRDEPGTVWGLTEVLQWFSLHETLDQYDTERVRVVPDPVDDSDDATDSVVEIQQTIQESRPRKNTIERPAIHPLENDVELSDMDSDLEPDELLSTYLRTKARLYELDPIAEDNRSKRKSGRGSRNSVNGSVGLSLGGIKLQQRLQKIESDALFDQYDADVRWASQKIDLARSVAERRRLQLSVDEDKEGTSTALQPQRASHDVNDEAEALGQALLGDSEEQDSDALIGGMFDTLPGVQQEIPANGAVDETNITIRHFAQSGMNPKRVLEEACKARDSRVKLRYSLVSPTTYVCRYSVTIDWMKRQGGVDGSYLPSIDVKAKAGRMTFTMIHEATSDTSQSEAYIAVVALFLIFSGSPKEEKAHMKLGAALRDFWDELAQLKRDRAMAEDLEAVKEVQQLISQNAHAAEDDDEDDEVVFNASSRLRSGMASGASTPLSGRPGTPRINEASQELRDLWARKVASPAYQRMLDGRMGLPMYQYKDAVLNTINRNQVTILVSETGSGKSTQLPAFILEHELSQGRHCKVYCTEPRRISAISLAQRVSEEMGEHKGDVGTMRSLVGYAIRLESHTSANTRLVYATTGIVLRMLERANGLDDITHLIIDEVHERSIDTDFLLIILRSLMVRRADLKVVLMSATVNAQRFSDYLNGAPIVDVPGRTFPVQAKFLEDAIELTGHTSEDATTGNTDADDEHDSDSKDKDKSGKALSGYSKRTLTTLATYDEYRIDYSLIVKLLQKVAFDPAYNAYSRATLIFLPGISEIRQLNDMLCGHPAFRQGWRIHPLHSSFTSDDQQAAFDIPPPGMRKIVLATNIAETGITIPDVTCVIDTGKHKEMRYDEKRQMSRLILSFIAKANAKQRRGRAGRVQEGICFHLFTKSRHDEAMADSQAPEMLRLSLQDLVMRVKICKLGDIENALSSALDPPSSKNIRRAIDALIEVDALTTSEELTPLGQQLAKLPLDAQLGKLVLLGSVFGCLDFVLTAAATLTSKSPFLSPLHAKKQAGTVRLGFKRGDSDLLTAYNAYCTWRKICSTSGVSEFHFCNKNFLSPQNLASIEELKGQLLSAVADAGFVQLGPNERAALSRVRPGSRQRNFVVLPEKYCRADDDDLVASAVVAWSFYPKIIRQEGKGWRNIANNQSLGLHPTSVNKGNTSQDVKLLSFYSIMQSSSRFTNAQETTPAPEVALVMLAGDAIFDLYAGVVSIDGLRMRYKVRDWRTMIVLKTLRARLKEVLARSFRQPGKELVGKQKAWMEVLERILGHRGKHVRPLTTL